MEIDLALLDYDEKANDRRCLRERVLASLGALAVGLVLIALFGLGNMWSAGAVGAALGVCAELCTRRMPAHQLRRSYLRWQILSLDAEIEEMNRRRDQTDELIELTEALRAGHLYPADLAGRAGHFADLALYCHGRGYHSTAEVAELFVSLAEQSDELN